ncbi:MAG: helix-turn-helix domain-containing protein [Parachlamydia sp.]|nr:helix-turn-helix domain-containing protein [Parachlamydia sp.]
MLGHTKKRHTKTGSRRKTAHRQHTEKPMSYDEAMDILLAGEAQGAVMLRGLRNREGITQAEMGKLLGIEQTNISKMERGIRPIGKNMAMRLAQIFKTDYRLFL